MEKRKSNIVTIILFSFVHLIDKDKVRFFADWKAK